MDDAIDEEGLLAAAGRAGEAVSSDQLKRWRRAGLVPRPRVEHASGLRGSRALYPAWAASHLVAVARLHRSNHRLESLCVAVWWDGHWVDSEALRRALIAPLERLSVKARAALVDAGGDPNEAAEPLLAAAPAKGSHSAIGRLVGKRLGHRRDLASLEWAFVLLGLGGTPPWEEEDRSLPDAARGALELLSIATGVDRALTDNPMGLGSWLPSTFNQRDHIDELRAGGAFELADLASTIRQASDAELEQARDDVAMLTDKLATITASLEGLLGRDIPALGSLSALAPEDGSGRAMLVRIMLVLRPLAGDAAFAAIAALVDREYERFAAITDLRAALPEHEAVLRVDYQQRLEELPPAAATRVRNDVARYLLDHEQIAERLTAGA